MHAMLYEKNSSTLSSNAWIREEQVLYARVVYCKREIFTLYYSFDIETMKNKFNDSQKPYSRHMKKRFRSRSVAEDVE